MRKNRAAKEGSKRRREADAVQKAARALLKKAKKDGVKPKGCVPRAAAENFIGAEFEADAEIAGGLWGWGGVE